MTQNFLIFSKNVLSEVPFSASLPKLENQKIYGIIDRLIIEENKVQIIDFKTNFNCPRKCKPDPTGILKQMSAYKQAVMQIFPDKEISCFILWTASKKLDFLKSDLLEFSNLNSS